MSIFHHSVHIYVEKNAHMFFNLDPIGALVRCSVIVEKFAVATKSGEGGETFFFHSFLIQSVFGIYESEEWMKRIERK